MKLKEIAEKLQGTVTGDGEIEISRVLGLSEAGPGDLSFVSNRKYLPQLATTRAAAVIMGRKDPPIPLPTIRVDYPYFGFAQALELFYRPPVPERGLHPTAVIDPTARLGKNPCVQAYACIGAGAVIGDDVTLYPHVVVYPEVEIGNSVTIHAHSILRERTKIGNRVLIHNGVVLGADGFGFVPLPTGTFYKIPQTGRVVIEDDVEVQSNTAIDRATVGETLIRQGTKIDNLVQVGHGCTVGRNTVICGQVGLAGSTQIGSNVMVGGQTGVAGHLKIGDRVNIGAQSGVMNDLETGQQVVGSPALPGLTQMKCLAALQKLPELFNRVRKLERQLTGKES